MNTKTETTKIAPTVDDLIDGYTRAQLVILAANVTEALRLTEAEARSKAKADALALIEAAGFDAHELFAVEAQGRAGAEAKPKAEKVIKYRDDKGNVWSGRGKRPNWVTAFVDAGGDLDTIKLA